MGHHGPVMAAVGGHADRVNLVPDDPLGDGPPEEIAPRATN